MSFYDTARDIFDTAAQGAGPAAFGILLDDAGALRIVDAEGWHPDALRLHYGARSVFQVTRSESLVTVDALSGGRSCTLVDDVRRPRRLLDLPGHSLF